MGDIRIGTVNTIDYKNGVLSVIYADRDNSITQDIPFLTFNGEYKMPSVGDNVLVLHLSNGSEMGVCLGTYWDEDNSPPETGKDIYYKKIAEKAFIKYQNKTLNLSAEHLIFSASEDGIEISLAEMLNRISILESGGING